MSFAHRTAIGLTIVTIVLMTSRYAQPQTKQPAAPIVVSSLEDVQVNMSADAVIVGLSKQGYSLKKEPADVERWVVSWQGKYVGEFFAEKGRVTSAEISLYNSNDPPKGGSGAIGMAEALYWIIHDNGNPAPAKASSEVREEIESSAQLTTREMDFRTPGTSFRMIFVSVNGSSYRITLSRSDDHAPYVFVTRLAPFKKRK